MSDFFGSSNKYDLMDSIELQKLKQRLLADKIDCCATIDELRLLIVSGARPDGIVVHGLTPLHYACYRGYYAAAKLLLVRGAEVNKIDQSGYSPVHLCAEKGNYKILKLLLQYMAQVCYVTAKDKKTEFPIRDSVDEPLRMAIRNSHYECTRLLLENGADANARYFDGPEITHVPPNKTLFLRLLLSHGADPNVFNRDGLSPLMKASRFKEKGIRTVQILLEKGASINALATPKKECRTALHYALFSGYLPMAKLLLSNGAAVNMPLDYKFSSPLDIAILRNDFSLVQLLLNWGANPNSLQGYYGSTLHTALYCLQSNDNNANADSNANQSFYKIIQLLLANKANPNLCDNSAASLGFYNGNTTLRLKSPMVEFLQCNNNKLPSIKILQLLLSYGGQILLCNTQHDLRGQLRNILFILEHDQLFGHFLLSLSETLKDVNLLEVLEGMKTRISSSTLDCIITFLRTPRRLSHICRLKIRKCINYHLQPFNSNCSMLKPFFVDTLPLPVFQKRFVLGFF